MAKEDHLRLLDFKKYKTTKLQNSKKGWGCLHIASLHCPRKKRTKQNKFLSPFRLQIHMDPKKPRREEKEEETPAVLKIEDMMFEIALGLSIPEILKWCMVNKSFGKMCKKKFPPEKLYELVLVDLEVLLNESIAVTERQDQTAEQAELERRKKVEHRMKEIIEMATSVNTDLPFHNMPKALALHRMMLHTEESRRFFLERLDIYFGIGSDKDWEELPKESKVTNIPPWLVKASDQKMELKTFEPRVRAKGKDRNFSWIFETQLTNKDSIKFKYDWKQSLEWQQQQEVMLLLENKIADAKLIVAVFPRDEDPIKQNAHIVQELFKLQDSTPVGTFVAYMSNEDEEIPIVIRLKLLMLEFEGSFLSQKWEVTLELDVFFTPHHEQFDFKPTNASIVEKGQGTTSFVNYGQIWSALGPAFTEPFVTTMLVNSKLRKRIVFPKFQV